MTNENTTITIGIDYGETTKAVMASLALAIASRKDEQVALPFERCRLAELVALKAKDTCTRLCAIFAGYISAVTRDEGGATIEFTLPPPLPSTSSALLAMRFEQALKSAVVATFLASVPQLTTETSNSQADSQRAISSIKQLLGLKTGNTSVVNITC